MFQKSISTDQKTNQNQQTSKPKTYFIEVKTFEGTIKRYIKNDLLGTGGFARCYQMTLQSTGQKYAVKIVKKSQLKQKNMEQGIKSQILIHRQIHHEHIVKFIDWFQNKDYYYLLLQKCNHYSLHQLIKKRKYLTELQVRYYIRQILLALQYLKQNKIIHRDIKLQNIFITHNLQIKLGDFGLATKLADDNQRQHTHCGTLNYIAPQILSDNQEGYSYEVDVWSLGVATFKLLYGIYPFQDFDQKIVQKKIKQCNYNFYKNQKISDQAIKFIRKILQLNPTKRPTVSQLLTDQFITWSQIPRIMPNSTISFTPQKSFIKQYQQKNISQKNDKVLCDTNENDTNNSTQIQLKQKQSEKKKISRKSNECFKEIDWIIYLKQYDQIGIAYVTNQNFMFANFNNQVMVVANPQLEKLQVFESYDTKNSQTNFQFLEVYQFQKKLPEHFKLFFCIASELIQNLVMPQKYNQAQSDTFDKNFKYPTSIYPFENGHIIQFSQKEAQFIQQNKIFIKVSSKQVTYEKENQRIVYFRAKSQQTTTVSRRLAGFEEKTSKQKIQNVLMQMNQIKFKQSYQDQANATQCHYKVY